MKKKSQYIKEYNVPDILAMIRNNRRQPKTCTDGFQKRLVVITGATSGIGYVATRKYASMGANLLCITRNEEKSKVLKAEIENEFGVTCDYLLADLSKMQDVLRLAGQLQDLQTPIDVLIHNAGVFLTKKELTEEGIEKVFMVQHLSTFILNMLLAEKLKAQEQARIILVNSEGHRFAAWGLKLDDLNWERRRYSGMKSYGSAKLAQLLTMQVFTECFKDTGVSINAMHPGAVRSDTGQENGPLYRWYKRNILDRMLRPTEISAESLYYLGASPEVKNESGKFFNLTMPETPAPPALDKEAAYEIWNKSLEMTQLQDEVSGSNRKGTKGAESKINADGTPLDKNDK